MVEIHIEISIGNLPPFLRNRSVLLAGEHAVKILQFPTFALGEEYINNRDPCRLRHTLAPIFLPALTTQGNTTHVQHGKNNISPPSNIRQRNGRNLHDDKITNPITRRGNRAALLP